MDIKRFRKGFEACFGYETINMHPYTKGTGELCFLNGMKAVSYIPIVSTIAWSILLCKMKCQFNADGAKAKAFLARMIICITGFGFLLPIPDIIATILLHTNKANRQKVSARGFLIN